jgi:SAM-dependent methyltransferase
MSQDNYIIAGGAEGKKRLGRLGGVLNEGTINLLLELHPNPIEKFLDLGCGGGSLTLAMAKQNPAAQFKGMDFDENLLSLARQDAKDAGLTNVQFESGDANVLNSVAEFDIVYARFLLSHLTNPVHVLNCMHEAAKPDGLVLAEDIDFSGHYCYPHNDAFNRYQQWFVTAAGNNGQDANIGLRLRSLFSSAGFSDVQFNVINPVFTSGSGKWMAFDTLEKIRGTVLKQGIATEKQIDDTLAELKLFTEDENSIISMPRIFQAWGLP